MSTMVIWVFAISLFASFVQRVSGFGFGIIAMAVFTYLLPSYGEACAARCPGKNSSPYC